jgi:hypothetical protein
MNIRTKSSLRSVKDIRTHSGRVDRTDVPYMAFMKISCLEMERARSEQERRSAMTRIGNIDSRLAEIENEKEGLLVRLGERTVEGLRHQRKISLREPRTSMRQPKTSSNENDGFKIRY